MKVGIIRNYRVNVVVNRELDKVLVVGFNRNKKSYSADKDTYRSEISKEGRVFSISWFLVGRFRKNKPYLSRKETINVPFRQVTRNTDQPPQFDNKT